MATLYKGAAPGTYWNLNDAKKRGFTTPPTVRPPNPAAAVSHITVASNPSPYLSLTASYAVAYAYAATGASAETPGYIYEIDTTLAVLNLIDPLHYISGARSITADHTLPTHHDGGQDLILGIADAVGHGAILSGHPARPGTAFARPAGISPELNAVVFALRDAEVLALSAIPATCIVHRHAVP